MSTMWLDLLGSQVRFYGKQFKTRAIEAGEGDLLVLIHGVGGHTARKILSYAGDRSVVARAFGQTNLQPSFGSHELQQSIGITIVYVTHDQSEAMSVFFFRPAPS